MWMQINQGGYQGRIQFICQRSVFLWRIGINAIDAGDCREPGVEDPLDPQQNIFGGTKFLHRLLDDKNNNISLALAAYNAGPGAVDKYGGIPPYSETQTYVNRVLNYLT
jgi:soluble lytic murein transglycosylase-like protein